MFVSFNSAKIRWSNPQRAGHIVLAYFFCASYRGNSVFHSKFQVGVKNEVETFFVSGMIPGHVIGVILAANGLVLLYLMRLLFLLDGMRDASGTSA